MLTALELVFLASGTVAVALTAIAYRWHPRVGRDGAIFVVAMLLFARGLASSPFDPSLIYSGIATLGAIPLIRGTVDKVKDSAP